VVGFGAWWTYFTFAGGRQPRLNGEETRQSFLVYVGGAQGWGRVPFRVHQASTRA
jgi:hypothetical protein